MTISLHDFARTSLWVAALLASVGGLTQPAQAAELGTVRLTPSGALDPAFGGGMRRFSAPGCSEARTTGIATLADGKQIVVGRACDRGFAMRFNGNGTPDATFGNEGVAFCAVKAEAVALDASNRIVVAGSSPAGVYGLARFTTAGTVDLEVSTNFKSLTNEIAKTIAIQADGRIVVAGSGLDSDTGRLVMTAARYLPSGALDTSYETDGKVIVDFRSAFHEGAFGVALDRDGKAVLGGYALVGTSATAKSQLAAARLNVDGTLDTSFHEDGKVLVEFPSSSAYAASVAIDASNRVVLGGWAVLGGAQIALARVTSAGALDTTFGTGGRVLTDMDSDDASAQAIRIQGNGMIVVAGNAYASAGYVMASARYTPSGALDPSYSGDGKVAIDFANVDDEIATAVAIDGNGRIVMAGDLWRYGL